jgi:hypothetical protein
LVSFFRRLAFWS